jgi:photosynthetic reaction center H subunit
MQTGAITSHLDVAQIVLYAFWIFFAGLIIYLRREDKREGYPLDSDRTARAERVKVVGFPAPPDPKVYHLPHGGTHVKGVAARDTREIRAEPAGAWPGAPLVPTGNPMLDAVGPAAYAERDDSPELTLEGAPRIAPMRVASGFYVEPRDPDPREMPVVAADRKVAGIVKDIWVDTFEQQIRFLEVETVEAGGQRVLLPMGFARVDARRGQIRVKSVLAKHFADVPRLANPDQVTPREEDRIAAYFASGHLYALPSRQESLL